MRSSLRGGFGVFKTLMGLEPFEVRFFFGEKSTTFDLALKRIDENRSKNYQELSIMCLTI